MAQSLALVHRPALPRTSTWGTSSSASERTRPSRKTRIHLSGTLTVTDGTHYGQPHTPGPILDRQFPPCERWFWWNCRYRSTSRFCGTWKWKWTWTCRAVRWADVGPEVHKTFGRSGQIRSQRSCMLASRLGQSPDNATLTSTNKLSDQMGRRAKIVHVDRGTFITLSSPSTFWSA